MCRYRLPFLALSHGHQSLPQEDATVCGGTAAAQGLTTISPSIRSEHGEIAMTVAANVVGFKTTARLVDFIGLPWGASLTRSAVRKVEAWMPVTYPITESSHQSCRGGFATAGA